LPRSYSRYLVKRVCGCDFDMRTRRSGCGVQLASLMPNPSLRVRKKPPPLKTAANIQPAQYAGLQAGCESFPRTNPELSTGPTRMCLESVPGFIAPAPPRVQCRETVALVTKFCTTKGLPAPRFTAAITRACHAGPAGSHPRRKHPVPGKDRAKGGSCFVT